MAKFRNQVCQSCIRIHTWELPLLILQLDAIGTGLEEKLPHLENVSYIPTYCMQGIRY